MGTLATDAGEEARRPSEPVPPFVQTLLASPPLLLAARIALTSPFWIGGANKLLNWNGAVAEAGHFGLSPPGLVAAATILVELVGSAMVILRRWTWLGAGALGVFTILATLIAHDFWNTPPAERTRDMNTFFEHLAIVAGLFLAAALAHRKR